MRWGTSYHAQRLTRALSSSTVNTLKSKRTPLQWAVRAGKASIAYRIDQARVLPLLCFLSRDL